MLPFAKQTTVAIVLFATAALGGAQALTSLHPQSATVVAASSAAATIDVSKPLPPLDLTGLALYNWDAKWHASEWVNPNGPLPWRYGYISRSGGDVTFKLDAIGAPQLQAMNGTPAHRRGLWETDVTLPELQEGLIVAPLWLYDQQSRDEIDFELVGRRGLDVSMHVHVNGEHKRDTVRLFAGQDLSGQRKRFGIAVDEDAGLVDLYVDGRHVHRWDRSKMDFFVSRPLKPWIEMWAANPTDPFFVSWVGTWTGLPAGKTLTMTVHGYRYTG